MAKECVNCVHKSDFKAVECGTCVVCYMDGLQHGLPSNFKPKPKTNADRIRAMSDEEMALFLADEVAHGDCYDCNLDCYHCDRGQFENSCQNAHYMWLQKPVGVDHE